MVTACSPHTSLPHRRFCRSCRPRLYTLGLRVPAVTTCDVRAIPRAIPRQHHQTLLEPIRIHFINRLAQPCKHHYQLEQTHPLRIAHPRLGPQRAATSTNIRSLPRPTLLAHAPPTRYLQQPRRCLRAIPPHHFDYASGSARRTW